MHLRLLQWPLCGDWSPATPPSSRTKRCASSSWRPDSSPGKMCLSLICFLQRLISQNHGYIPPFFEVLHFYKTSLLCEVMRPTFADMKHLKSLRTRIPDLYDFIQDPGHHQQLCVYIRLSPWHSPYYIGATEQDVLRREHSRCRKYLQLLRGQHAFFEPALHYWRRSNNYWLFFAIPVEIKLPSSSVWIQESKWQHMLRPHLNAPWVHRLLRKIGFREHLVDFRRHSLSSPTSLSLHKRFRRRLHPDLHRQLRPEMLDDIQAHYSTLYRLGSNTGASFQTIRDLLSAAFPSTQLYYFLRLSTFVNEPFRSKAQKLLAQVLRKRQLQVPTTMTQLLLPPLHDRNRNWKAQLGTWLQRWVASHRDLFPSLFLPKIRVVETRSATLGDRIYNYRKWQRRWTPDTSFPCRCIDRDDRTTYRAHTHAVILDDFSRINADIDPDIMAASMKDQYFGDVDKLQQRFDMPLRKLARRWHVQRSSFSIDYQPVLTKLIDEHRFNVQDRAHWTAASLQRTTRSLSSWVVIPADHPSQIKGVRSANDQMFTYSSWSSRSWLIVRGAQPEIQQQIGLNALKGLYEAKGFNPHLLRDVRRRVASKLACCLVAVALVASLSVCLLVCARMCVVGSDSAPGRDSADHQPGHPRTIPEFHQRQ